MEEIKIQIPVKKYTYDELPEKLELLKEAALEAAENAYAPYSNFQVGAAVLLENGTVVKGSNQENAAYPSGLCAERVALFYAHSTYPNMPIDTLAVVAVSEGEIVEEISPCGGCRQVMLEYESKFNKAFNLALFNENFVYLFEKASDLLPLTFTKDNM